jgi:tetratricopeptide (TPR) repeat protein
LAADARNEGDGFSSAFLKLVAGLLGVRFDALRRRDARRRQLRWTLAIAASLLLSATMAFLAWDATQARDVARAAQAQAELELESERQTRGFLLSVFQLADAERSHDQNVTVREVLDRAVVRIDSTRFARPAIKSRFLATMGQAYSSLGLYKRSMELLRESLAALPGKTMSAEAWAQRFDSQIELADVLNNMGDYAAASTLLDAMDAAVAGGSPVSAAQRARSKNVRGDVLAYTEHDADAMLAFREAIAVIDAAPLTPEDKAMLRSRSMAGIALLLHYAGDYGEADRYHAQVIELLEATVGDLHPATISAILSRGSSAYASGNAVVARAAWDRALVLAQKIYDEDAPEIGTIKNNLGRLSLETGNLVRAEQLLRDALRSDHKHRGAQFDDLAYPLNNLALARLFQDDRVEARTLLEQALPIAEKAHHAMLGPILTTLAELDCTEGQLPAGTALAERALATTREHDGDGHWHTASAVLVANLCRAAAKQPLQRSEIDAALAIVHKRWNPESPFARHAQALYDHLRIGT